MSWAKRITILIAILGKLQGIRLPAGIHLPQVQQQLASLQAKFEPLISPKVEFDWGGKDGHQRLLFVPENIMALRGRGLMGMLLPLR